MSHDPDVTGTTHLVKYFRVHSCSVRHDVMNNVLAKLESEMSKALFASPYGEFLFLRTAPPSFLEASMSSLINAKTWTYQRERGFITIACPVQCLVLGVLPQALEVAPPTVVI